MSMDVLLAVMPFGEIRYPTLGVSMLKAEAQAHGFTAGVRYFSLDFASLIGPDLYRQLISAFGSTSMIGDWVFSEALFRESAPPADEFVRFMLAEHRRLEDPEADLRRFEGRTFSEYLEEDLMPQVVAARRECLAFTARVAREIAAVGPRVVGFTTVSHQTCASLAVARCLKEMDDPPVVLFGGANCQGEMGLQLLRSFPWVDYVCTGEGDVVFPAFLRRLLHEGNPSPLPGMLRQGESREATLPPPIADLDRLPTPDFSDYYRQLAASPLRESLDTGMLPMETSRGCWWGAKHQCGFCGNHPALQAFRKKSPERVLREIRELASAHAPRHVMFADDLLDPGYFDTVFAQLGQAGPRFSFFCETKVNVSYEDLARMRSAGLPHLQFGIETLSNRILRSIPKGCSVQQCLQALRWCEELGIRAAWNLLCGFPQERPEDYAQMEALIPLLAHLPPPLGCIPIALKRFSPYFHSPEKYGLKAVRPEACYAHIHALPPEEIAGLAYYFHCEHADGRDAREYTRGVRRAVGAWMAYGWMPPEARPSLELYRSGEALVIADTRPCAVQGSHRLEGVAAQVYLLCDTAQSPVSLARKLGDSVAQAQVQQVLADLVRAKLVWEDEGKYLALAIFRNRQPTKGKG